LDNITHSLVGLVLADGLLALRAHGSNARGTPPVDGPPKTAPVAPAGALAGATVLVAMLANNAPDLDFLYRRITPGKLGYLLHHRGHTHTLLATLPLALVCVTIAAGWVRLRRERLPLREYGFLLAVAVLGGCLHVLFDFGNNYGVHPFWPLDDHWYYGDAIFIVDPWLIVALAGVALGARRTKAARGVLWFIVLGLLAIAWISQLLGVALAAALSAVALSWLLWLQRAGPRRRWWSASIGLGTLAAVLLGTRFEARANVRRALAREPGTLVSLGSTPAPGNPLCWWVLAAEQVGDDYVVRQALVAGWPRLSSVSACHWPSHGTTAPLQPSQLGERAQQAGVIEWGPEFRAPLAQLRALVRENCVARAFTRYARMPYWVESSTGPAVIGDLRFDRSRALDFTDLELTPEPECPHFVPPWQPPLPLLSPSD
jgi:inner membrane protein